MIAGIFLTYLGFLSPIFRRSSERLAPDRWVGTFRIIARIAGPLLCIAVGLKIFADIRQENVVEALDWHPITSQEGRFRISAPAEFVKKVNDVPYGGQRVNESCFRAVLPKLEFLVSYLDWPASIPKAEPSELLNTELAVYVQVSGLKLLGKEATRVAGYPAIHFRFQNSAEGFFVEGFLLLAKQRRYQLAAKYTNESSAPNREKFFKSFQVLDGP